MFIHLVGEPTSVKIRSYWLIHKNAQKRLKTSLIVSVLRKILSEFWLEMFHWLWDAQLSEVSN